MYNEKGQETESVSQLKNNPNKQQETRTPRVDLFEMDEQYYLRLSLPGVKKENLKVSFNEHGHLEIKGNVSTIVPENLKGTVIQEIYQGPFFRTVQIPGSVNKQTIQFGYNGGILEIYIQKADNE